MEEESKLLRIKPFDGNGFNNWCFRMKAYLQQLDVIHCVEKAAEDEDFWNITATDTNEVKATKTAQRAVRMKQDNKCRSVLIQAIADSHLEELVEKGQVDLKYLQTEDQVADIMTKGLPSPRFCKLREKLGVIN